VLRDQDPNTVTADRWPRDASCFGSLLQLLTVFDNAGEDPRACDHAAGAADRDFQIRERENAVADPKGVTGRHCAPRSSDAQIRGPGRYVGSPGQNGAPRSRFVPVATPGQKRAVFNQLRPCHNGGAGGDSATATSCRHCQTRQQASTFAEAAARRAGPMPL